MTVNPQEPSKDIQDTGAQLPGPPPTDALPVETLHQILCWAVYTNMTAAVLWYYHVCRRWRIILIDDKSLCGRVAFVFRRLELIELFLTRAGDSPLPLDFDDILQRTDRAEEHRNVLLGALLDNTERLCNAVTIKNLLGRPWFSRLWVSR